MYTFFSLNKTSILIQQGCIKLISKVTKDFYFKLMLFNFLVKVSKKKFDEDLIKEMLKYHEILNTGLLMLKFSFANTEINYILKYVQKENGSFKFLIIFHNITVFVFMIK